MVKWPRYYGVSVPDHWFEGPQKILSVALNPRSPISHRLPKLKRSDPNLNWGSGFQWMVCWRLLVPTPPGSDLTPHIATWFRVAILFCNNRGCGQLSHWQKSLIILLRNAFFFHIFCNLSYGPPWTIQETIASFSRLITSFLC